MQMRELAPREADTDVCAVRSSARVSSALACLLASGLGMLSGCVGTELTPHTAAPANAVVAKATLVVGDITRPRDLVASSGNPFYAAMQADLPKQLETANVAQSVVIERDLPKDGVQGRAYVVRYRVIEDTTVVLSSGGLCFGLLVGFGSLTLVPLAFLGLCSRTAEHRMTVEARIFETGGMPVKQIQDSSSNEMLNIYDTSAATPVLRKTYPIDIKVKAGLFHHPLPNSEEQLALFREEASEAARQLLAGSLNDITNAMRTAVAE